MKVMIFGSKTIVQKLTESLKGIRIELVRLTEVAEVIVMLKQKTFALVLVDSLAEQTELVCHRIREFRTVPLVLIVNERRADWSRLQSLGADGYLPEAAGKDELAARLGAMWRRFLPSDRFIKSGLRPCALHLGAEQDTGEIHEMPLGVEF